MSGVTDHELFSDLFSSPPSQGLFPFLLPKDWELRLLGVTGGTTEALQTETALAEGANLWRFAKRGPCKSSTCTPCRYRWDNTDPV